MSQRPQSACAEPPPTKPLPVAVIKRGGRGQMNIKKRVYRAYGRAEGKPVLKLRQVGWEAGVDEAQGRLS